jgi:hypothetical protein
MVPEDWVPLHPSLVDTPVLRRNNIQRKNLELRNS